MVSLGSVGFRQVRIPVVRPFQSQSAIHDPITVATALIVTPTYHFACKYISKTVHVLFKEDLSSSLPSHDLASTMDAKREPIFAEPIQIARDNVV